MDDIVKVDKKPKYEDSTGKKLSKRTATWYVVAVVVAASLGAAGYFYKQYNDIKQDPSTAQTEKNQAETDRILSKLKRAILITEQEAPTVARVEDPEKLKSTNKEFYKDIQKGDYLIIFPRRAIIFRESNNQIINVAPIINTSDLKANQGTTPAQTTN